MLNNNPITDTGHVTNYFTQTQCCVNDERHEPDVASSLSLKLQIIKLMLTMSLFSICPSISILFIKKSKEFSKQKLNTASIKSDIH